MTVESALLAIVGQQAPKDGDRREDRNNLALADQFQFSSLLKLYVTPPEKEIQLARGEPDPLQKPARPSTRDDEPSVAPKPKSAARPDQPRESSNASRREDDDPEFKFDPVEAKEDLSRATENGAPERPEKADPPKGERAAEVNLEKGGVPPPPDGADAQAAAIIATAFAPAAASVSTSGDATVRGNRTGDTPRIGQGDAPAAKPNAGQSTFIAAASAGGETGEDAESADFVSRVKPETGDQRNTSAGTTNPAVARQSADLAQRLGLNQLPNQVSVTVETASANGPASLNLAPNAVLADPGTSDDGAPAFTTSQGKSGSAHVAPDRQDIGRGAQPPTADTLGQTLPQSGPTGSGQTAGGAQLAAVAAQTSAATASVVGAKALPAAVEPAPIGGTSSLNGPGQLTETAKPTPAQPPRQPVPTRTAAEQIAVQIQKGFGGGADKISIRLHPAQLGRVDVKLEVSKDGHLVAAITADKPETLEMLQRDARILERALQDAGLQTNSDSLSFMLRGENANQALPEDRGAGGPLAQGDETDPSNQADDDLAAGGTVHGRNMASDGHIDITV